MPFAILIFLSDLMRIGEALNPGPEIDPMADDTFVLGTFNPSGLRNKLPYISSQLAYGDVWAISETHFTGQDAQVFRKSLACSDTDFRYFVSGHPVAPKKVCSQSWKGVGVSSKHPTRCLPVSWPKHLVESSRGLVSTTLLDDVWMTGGTFYGEPESHLYPDHRFHNEQLLRHLAIQVCHLNVGPRFLAGDLNEVVDSLPAFDIIRAAGFQDLQELALARWGHSLRPTCKRVTRKDFCFVSPELASLLLDVRVHNDIWPDHAVVEGVFRRLSKAPPRMVWPTPSAMPWPKQFEIPEQWWDVHTTDPTGQYVKLWNLIETSASAQLPFVVPRHQRGRGATLNTKCAAGGRIAPTKRARLGDFQPNFHGVSIRHAQWVRQTRRLQSYVRHISSKEVFDAHALLLWSSVCRAKGFCPDFATWWGSCQHSTTDAPTSCPVSPPSGRVAQAMFESLSLAVRALEKELTMSSRQYARLRRVNNPNLIFQDIKAAPAQGIELLCRPVVSTVAEVNESDCSLVLASTQSWNVSRPLVVNGDSHEIIHHDTDCVWLDSIEGIHEGMQVSQVLCKGSTDDLASEFLSTWGERWKRHDDVPADRWSKILQFAQEKLPRGHLPWISIDEEMLKGCILRKKSTTSAGLDGVSIQDLRAMPTSVLQNFCRTFTTAEMSGQWPAQVVDGRVTSLAKTEAPQSASDFRPITVLSLIYRCYGTIHAKHAIRVLEDILPAHLYGSRPGCYAAQLWTHILWAIEFSFCQDIRLSGLIADIQKAFNHLPREVVIACCLSLGFPFPVIKAWSGAMATSKRRFAIRGCLSAPIGSSTGYPEGDALSCIAMVCIDILFHAWLTHFFPLCQPMSFVDDWQVITCCPTELPGIRSCLLEFVHEVDLLLDDRKTFAWSICPAARAALKQDGFKVELDCRNLGAQCQMSRKHSNKVQTDRFSSLTGLWPKLRLSACRYEAKLRALHTAAWPKAMHAIAATTVSLAQFHHLRTGAMRGLHADSAGSNAFVHLGLIHEPISDPHFWAILSTFRLVRACANRAEVREAMIGLSQGTLSCPNNSVTFTLLTRLHLLSWHVTKVGNLRDEIGEFSLFNSSFAEVAFRAGLAWQKVVSQEVSHRPGFQHLSRCDPFHTRKWLSSLPACDAALMRKLLNGTHITQDCKQYCQPGETDCCPFCGSVDSRYHRFWLCPHFDSLRADVPADILKLISSLPESLTCYGWAVRPWTQLQWWTLLSGLVCCDPVPCAPGERVVNFFTDGSCHYQHLPAQRFAAWSVIFAGDSGDGRDSYVHDCGPLPGLFQSAFRAEVFAILRAVQAARVHSRRLMIWTDCASAIAGLRKILDGECPAPNGPHSDLWQKIFHAVSDLPPGSVQVTKVQAHVGTEGSSPFEDWCLLHNHWADRTAVRANFNRPESFWKVFHAHVHACAVAQRLSRVVQDVLLNVSRAVVRIADLQEPEEVPCEPSVRPPAEGWRGLNALHKFPQAAARWYGQAMVEKVLSWWHSTLHDVGEQCVCVAHFQLHLDFQIATGCIGPIHETQWKDGDDLELVGLVNFPFRLRARWFAKMLKQCLRHASQHLTASYTVPKSAVLGLHTGCVAVPWPSWRLEAIDKWLVTRIPFGIRRRGDSLDVLPFACRDESWPVVPISSCGF